LRHRLGGKAAQRGIQQGQPGGGPQAAQAMAGSQAGQQAHRHGQQGAGEFRVARQNGQARAGQVYGGDS
jgi:hypothetical protein